MNTSVCSGINILQDFGIALAAVTINEEIVGFLDGSKANNSGHGGEIRGAIMVAMVVELMVVNLGIPLDSGDGGASFGVILCHCIRWGWDGIGEGEKK